MIMLQLHDHLNYYDVINQIHSILAMLATGITCTWQDQQKAQQEQEKNRKQYRFHEQFEEQVTKKKKWESCFKPVNRCRQTAKGG